jgi:mono/diheme cytochrome c family protein
MKMTKEKISDEAQSRENPDPHEKNRPIPVMVLVVVSALLIWAIFYILLTHSNDDPTLGDNRSMADLMPKSGNANAAPVDGAQIYMAQCVACHQATGAGLAGVFPPLADSEWVLAKETVPINIVLHGVNGQLTVKGTTYNGAMPSFKDKLNDAEITAVLNYVRSNFGNNAPKLIPDAVKKVRADSEERSQPWNGDDELTKIKE